MPRYEAEIEGQGKFQFEWQGSKPPSDQEIMSMYTDQKQRSEPQQSNMGKFLGAAKESVVDPIVNLPSQLAHPIDTAKGMFHATEDAVGRTREALGKGQFGDAAMSAVGALPVVGPSLEQPIRDLSHGAPAEAAGHALGPGLAVAAPEFAGPLGKLPVRGMAKIPGFLGKVGGGITGGAVGEVAGEAMGHPYLGGYAGYKVGSELGPKALDWAKGKVAEWDKTPKRGPDEPFKPNPAVARQLGSPPSGEPDMGGFNPKKSIPRKGPPPIEREPMKFEKSSAKRRIKERGSFSNKPLEGSYNPFGESDPDWNLTKLKGQAPPEGIARTTAKQLHGQGMSLDETRPILEQNKIPQPLITQILSEMRALGAH